MTRIGSLFAGIGGFDLAAERVGMEATWQSEIDQKASAVLDYHWPHVKNLGDVHNVRNPEPVDVLTGGFPCQDYSVAGERAGLAGDRGALWWEFHRLIAQLRPTWVVGENVPGLVSSRGGRDFATIVDSLVALGYGVAWRVLDAQWFGVAQRRRRVFIVGHSGGEPRPEVLALAQGVSGDTPPRRAEGSRVAPTLEAGANSTGGTRPPGTTVDTAESLQIVSALTANGLGGGGPGDNMAGESGTNQVPTIAALDGSGRFAVGVRRLTPLECERLQGFPDGWTDIPSNSDTQRFRQLGNAVAVPVTEWIMRRLMAEES